MSDNKFFNMVIWFTGLSGSGKTSISDGLKKKLEEKGYSIFQIDGDKFRKEQKTKNVFTTQEIIENNRRIISYCRSIQDKYDFIIVSVISPFEETRKKAREIFKDKYIEIFLNCSLEALIKRDIKGLYQKALKGEIDNLIGYSEKIPYEAPKNPEIVLATDKKHIQGCCKEVMSHLKNKKYIV